jgi:4-amino-4-deoxy-L-arabinose transferase-like glycosyltransferase
MTLTTTTLADPVELTTAPSPAPRVSGRRLVTEQGLVAVGQGLSGLGNMAFALLAAHTLTGTGFSQLVTFLALYLLLLVPTTGLAAGTAAAPDSPHTVSWAMRGAVPAGLLIAAASLPLGGLLHLPWQLIAALGVALPGSAALAIIRGRLYGATRPAAAVATLITEPIVRLGPGLVMMQLAGATGAALGVVLGGYLALLVGLIATRQGPTGQPAATRPSGAAVATATTATFTVLTLLQNIDIVLANRLLGAAAWSFAAVSTLGGISAFATATVPLVLLPRLGSDRDGDRRPFVVALTAAALLGGVLTLAAALIPGSGYRVLLGDRYAGIGSVAVPYLGAMALLGIARLYAARLCLRGHGQLVTLLAAVAIAVQVGWILLAPRTAAGVATGTEVGVATLASSLGITQLTTSRQRQGQQRQRRPSPTFWIVLGLTVAAAAVRLIVTRGLWVDEATSVTQAHMTYTGMLTNLRTTDVHPPGYFTVLWLWVRAFGFGPLSVRMPSILLGVALIPAMFGLVRDLFDRRTALIAAGFTVLAPQAVWYSQEARMYSMFMLLTVLAVWAQVRVLRNGSVVAWAAYTAATAGLVYTQYFTVLVIASQQLVFLTVVIARWRRGEPVRRTLLGWAASLAVVALLVAPLVPFVHQQFSTNQSAGRGFGAPSNTGTSTTTQAGLTAYSLIANLLWATWGYHSNPVMTQLGALWPAAMLVSLALLGRGRSLSTLSVAAVGGLPVAGMFLLGTQKQFLFDLRYFIGCVPMIVILGARAAATWPRSRTGVIALCSVLGVSLGLGLWDQQVNGNNPRRYDFAPSLQTVARHAVPGDDVVLTPGYLNDVANYYQPDLHYLQGNGSAASVMARTRRAPHVFVLASFFKVGGEKQQISALRKDLSAHRHLVRTWSFANVKVWEYQ